MGWMLYFRTAWTRPAVLLKNMVSLIALLLQELISDSPCNSKFGTHRSHQEPMFPWTPIIITKWSRNALSCYKNYPQSPSSYIIPDFLLLHAMVYAKTSPLKELCLLNYQMYLQFRGSYGFYILNLIFSVAGCFMLTLENKNWGQHKRREQRCSITLGDKQASSIHWTPGLPRARKGHEKWDSPTSQLSVTDKTTWNQPFWH